MAILNKYKNTLDDLIDSSNIEFSDQSDSLDWPEIINKGLCNVSKSKCGLSTLSKANRLDKDIPVTSLELTSRIQVS